MAKLSQAADQPGWTKLQAPASHASSFAPAPILAVLTRIGGALFLAAIALTPVAIVLVWPRGGGIWVAGYVVGIATVPIVAFAVLRSVNAIVGEEHVLPAFVLFTAIVVMVSIASALWAFS